MLHGCGQDSVQTQEESHQVEITEIGPADLQAKMQSGKLTLIDVRTEEEFKQGHVPSAQNIPLSKLSSSMTLLREKKDDPIYLICAVGGRSYQAAQKLATQGFSQPVNIEGGTRGWQAAGYPLE